MENMGESWKFVIGLAPGGIPAGLAVYSFATGHPILGIISIIFTYLVILLYDGATSGTSSVYGVTALFYGFGDSRWGVFFLYMVIFLGCFLIYWIREQKNK